MGSHCSIIFTPKRSMKNLTDESDQEVLLNTGPDKPSPKWQISWLVCSRHFHVFDLFWTWICLQEHPQFTRVPDLCENCSLVWFPNGPALAQQLIKCHFPLVMAATETMVVVFGPFVALFCSFRRRPWLRFASGLWFLLWVRTRLGILARFDRRSSEQCLKSSIFGEASCESDFGLSVTTIKATHTSQDCNKHAPEICNERWGPVAS